MAQQGQIGGKLGEPQLLQLLTQVWFLLAFCPTK